MVRVKYKNRIINFEGDTPPSDEDLDEVFNQIDAEEQSSQQPQQSPYAQQPVQPAQKPGRTRPEDLPMATQEDADFVNKSPLNLGQRFMYGLGSRASQIKRLEDKFGQGNVIQLENGKFAVRTEKGVQPIDEKGFSLGDIAEAALPTAVSTISVPLNIGGKILGAIGAPVTGGTSLVATSLASGAATGALETGRQQLGNLIYGTPMTDLDAGDIGAATLAGTVAPGASKVLGWAGKQIGNKLAKKAIPATVEEATKVIRPQEQIKSDIEKALTKRKEFENLMNKQSIYHGTGVPVKKLEEDFYSPLNYYGQGFYTTDAIDIAKGYSKKGGKTPSIYEITPKNEKLYDMEAPINKNLNEKIKSTIGENGLIDKEIVDDSKNLRELFDDIRDSLSGEGYSADEVQEYFDSITSVLKSEGYNGMTHIGGLKTGKAPHKVRIYFNPKEDIVLNKLKNPWELPAEKNLGEVDKFINELEAELKSAKEAKVPRVGPGPIGKLGHTLTRFFPTAFQNMEKMDEFAPGVFKPIIQKIRGAAANITKEEMGFTKLLLDQKKAIPDDRIWRLAFVSRENNDKLNAQAFLKYFGEGNINDVMNSPAFKEARNTIDTIYNYYEKLIPEEIRLQDYATHKRTDELMDQIFKDIPDSVKRDIESGQIVSPYIWSKYFQKRLIDAPLDLETMETDPFKVLPDYIRRVSPKIHMEPVMQEYLDAIVKHAESAPKELYRTMVNDIKNMDDFKNIITRWGRRGLEALEEEKGWLAKNKGLEESKMSEVLATAQALKQTKEAGQDLPKYMARDGINYINNVIKNVPETTETYLNDILLQPMARHLNDIFKEYGIQIHIPENVNIARRAFSNLNSWTYISKLGASASTLIKQPFEFIKIPFAVMDDKGGMGSFVKGMRDLTAATINKKSKAAKLLEELREGTKIGIQRRESFQPGLELKGAFTPYKKMEAMALSPLQHLDYKNVEAALLSGYHYGKDVMKLSHEGAMAMADRVAEMTMGDMSKYNSTMLGRTIFKPAMAFQTYTMNYLRYLNWLKNGGASGKNGAIKFMGHILAATFVPIGFSKLTGMDMTQLTPLQTAVDVTKTMGGFMLNAMGVPGQEISRAAFPREQYGSKFNPDQPVKSIRNMVLPMLPMGVAANRAIKAAEYYGESGDTLEAMKRAIGYTTEQSGREGIIDYLNPFYKKGR